jgi:hypothetical protein
LPLILGNHFTAITRQQSAESAQVMPGTVMAEQSSRNPTMLDGDFRM